MNTAKVVKPGDSALRRRARKRRPAATLQIRPELPDYLRPGLDVVFVGFNPGDRSSRIGHYYAGRGNQFWNFLFESGVVPERLRPEDDHRVLEFGVGLTDVVKRWSKSSSVLHAEDYRRGSPALLAKLQQAAPRLVAFNGKLAYEKFSRGSARLGWQPRTLAGAKVFVLPSTSGRNGSLTREAKLRYFRQLAQCIKKERQRFGWGDRPRGLSMVKFSRSAVDINLALLSAGGVLQKEESDEAK